MTRHEALVRWVTGPWVLPPDLPTIDRADVNVPTIAIKPHTIMVLPGRVERGWRTVVLGQGGS